MYTHFTVINAKAAAWYIINNFFIFYYVFIVMEKGRLLFE